MAFHDDVTSIFKTWKGSSVTTKILLVLSSYFTVNSLATLSESIVKWRLFFRDAIDFYNTIISDNFYSFLNFFTSLFNYDLPTYISDVVILAILFMSAFFRSIWGYFGPWFHKAVKDLKKKDLSSAQESLAGHAIRASVIVSFHYCLSYLVCWAFLVILFLSIDEYIPVSMFIVVTVIFAVLVPLIIFGWQKGEKLVRIGHLHIKQNRDTFGIASKSKTIYQKYLLWIGAHLVLVGIFAAINTGLTAPI